MPSLIWFRRDLRVQDNPALVEACNHATTGVIALFILTPETWLKHAVSAVQINFILANLHELSVELEKLNIPLLIRSVNSFKSIPDLLEKLSQKFKIDSIYFNRQYEWDERARDAEIIKKLSYLSLGVNQFDDQVIIPPEKILNQQNEPFKVFTPFKKKWLSMAELDYKTPLRKPKAQLDLNIKSDTIPNQLEEFINPIPAVFMPKPGEAAAVKALRKFCNEPIVTYQKTRDYPALDATSHLSSYLAVGILSPGQCIARVMLEHNIFTFSEFFSNTGISTWVSELIWREFYKMILFHYPQVSKNRAFKPATEHLAWSYDETLFNKWCDGMTGFPLVDAGMRQLNQTGWMHNRLRMVTAMFLSKILFIDWRLGERYFSEKLIDYDLSANNGGWQWSASTGTDSVPYFRIFNPITQSKNFDAEGKFIRQFCPELLALSDKEIHDPFAAGISPSIISYPQKIVDYKIMREKTLQAFKSL